MQIFSYSAPVHSFSIDMQKRRLCQRWKRLVQTVDHDISAFLIGIFRKTGVKAKMRPVCLIHDQWNVMHMDRLCD